MPGMLSAEPVSASHSPATPPTAGTAPHFDVRAYIVAGNPLLPTNTLASLLSPYTGSNLGLDQIVKAASVLQWEYHDQGYPAVSVAFVPEEITDGIVTFNVAQTAIPQIVVAGERYLSFQQRHGNCLPTAGGSRKTNRSRRHYQWHRLRRHQRRFRRPTTLRPRGQLIARWLTRWPPCT